MARETHRISLWVPAPLLGTLRERAARSRLGLSYEAREALERGLAGGRAAATIEAVERAELAALCALFAAEQLIRFFVKHYPEGERRMSEVREAALEQAEERLGELRDRFELEVAR